MIMIKVAQVYCNLLWNIISEAANIMYKVAE